LGKGGGPARIAGYSYYSWGPLGRGGSFSPYAKKMESMRKGKTRSLKQNREREKSAPNEHALIKHLPVNIAGEIVASWTPECPGTIFRNCRDPPPVSRKFVRGNFKGEGGPKDGERAGWRFKREREEVSRLTIKGREGPKNQRGNPLIFGSERGKTEKNLWTEGRRRGMFVGEWESVSPFRPQRKKKKKRKWKGIHDRRPFYS